MAVPSNALLPWINSAGAGGVRNSMVTYQGDGSTTNFDFNFTGGYIDQSHVKAYVYDDTSGLTTPWTPVFIGPNTVKYEPALPSTKYLVVYRDTQKTVPLVDFSTGAPMTEENLDMTAEQSVFVAAEMADRFDSVNSSSADAIVRSYDALTKAEDALDASAAATATSDDARAKAVSAESKADSAVATANNAESVALGIDAKATQALAESGPALAAANSAVSTANDALAIAQQQTMPATGGTFTGPVYGPTAALGANNNQLATTSFVQATIKEALIGQIVWEARTSARAGYIKLNGALLNRADYPALWAYAQASGALVADATWIANSWGCFSYGDGSTTFRIPDLRGEFVRCWDDGRGADGSRVVGTYQASQNLWHSHSASTGSVGDHAHSAWTDAQGWHGHHGWTGVAGNHSHGVGGDQPMEPRGGWSYRNAGGSWSAGSTGDGNHQHEFWTDGDGTHSHNVGVGGAGAHSHTVTVNGDGGAEVRVRNVALLAMMRAI